MDCYECNTKSNESILSCSCGKMMCLHKAKMLSLNRYNGAAPKYVLDSVQFERLRVLPAVPTF